MADFPQGLQPHKLELELLAILPTHQKKNIADFDNCKGPYIVQWGSNSTTCRGPKSVNLTSYTTTLVKQDNGFFRYIIDITAPESVKIDEIRMNVNTLKDGKKSILWNYNVNKPCQHYMLAAMLETYFGVKNCILKKGQVVVDLPLTELMMKHFGNMFFYGQYLIKVNVTSKKGNLCCLVFDPQIIKKTEKS